MKEAVRLGMMSKNGGSDLRSRAHDEKAFWILEFWHGAKVPLYRSYSGKMLEWDLFRCSRKFDVDDNEPDNGYPDTQFKHFATTLSPFFDCMVK